MFFFSPGAGWLAGCQLCPSCLGFVEALILILTPVVSRDLGEMMLVSTIPLFDLPVAKHHHHVSLSYMPSGGK